MKATERTRWHKLKRTTEMHDEIEEKTQKWKEVQITTKDVKPGILKKKKYLIAINNNSWKIIKRGSGN